VITPLHASGPDSARALLAAIVESSDDAIISKTLDGTITSWNAAAERILGYAAHEAVGRPITLIIPPERLHEEAEIIGRIRAGLRVDHFETVRLTKTGARIDLSVTVSPVRDGFGAVIGASKVARDISERRRHEAQMRRYREDLEAAIAQRTAELEESHRQLRIAERFAAIGTLAAGFGHDMANLLLPIFARLDSMESAVLAPDAREDLDAVRAAARYLQRVASSLRLMAMDPAEEGSTRATDLASWWEDSRSVFYGVLPRHVRLEHDLGPGLAVMIARHRLTQVVFNLVQNAGEALAAGPAGTIRVTATPRPGPAGDGVLITVADNGPGMTEEVRRRCFDPYFSTKGRAISTGMGLSLVRSLVQGAGGEVNLDTAPGRGATFELWLPAAPPPEPAARATALTPSATVSLLNPGAAAFAVAILATRNIGASRGRAPSPADIIWITQDPDPAELQSFLARPGRRVLLVLPAGSTYTPAPDHADRVSTVPCGDAGLLRRALLSLGPSPAGAPAEAAP
jgi:PAS domain S-box-containing protein